jgi:CRISPR-associated protein Csx16
MTTWFVTRHAGAREWAQRQGVEVDRTVEHLELDRVASGDHVLGTLPVNLVCELNERGARYFHLVLPLGPDQRGREITADLMQALEARLEEYRVQRVRPASRVSTQPIYSEGPNGR